MSAPAAPSEPWAAKVDTFLDRVDTLLADVAKVNDQAHALVPEHIRTTTAKEIHDRRTRVRRT